ALYTTSHRTLVIGHVTTCWGKESGYGFLTNCTPSTGMSFQITVSYSPARTSDAHDFSVTSSIPEYKYSNNWYKEKLNIELLLTHLRCPKFTYSSTKNLLTQDTGPTNRRVSEIDICNAGISLVMENEVTGTPKLLKGYMSVIFDPNTTLLGYLRYVEHIEHLHPHHMKVQSSSILNRNS
ncbi:hypothetical protein GcC1_216035, partial [Golovinomyces cichoracearum]